MGSEKAVAEKNKKIHPRKGLLKISPPSESEKTT